MIIKIRLYRLIKNWFIFKVWRNFILKNGISRVGDFSYTVILSFMPFTVSVAIIINLFPMSHNLTLAIEKFIFSHFLPSTGDFFYRQFLNSLSHVNKLSWYSFSLLFMTTYLMLRSLEKHINEMWNIRSHRSLPFALFIYFLFIIIGPIFVLLMIVLQTLFKNYLFVKYTAVLIWANRLSYLITFMIFAAIYQILPAVRVRFSSALFAAIIATICFEIAKQCFLFYASNFPVYDLLYGSLAVMPLFLVWVYISSFILLFCAQIIYILEQHYIERIALANLKSIQVIGHRGCRSFALENHIYGYEKALDIGVDAIDIDVVLTRDKVLIAYHDLMINPNILCDNDGNYLANNKSDILSVYTPQQIENILIKNYTFNELTTKSKLQLNPNSKYAKYFPHQKQHINARLNSLQQIIDYINQHEPNLAIQIEIKNSIDNPEWSFDYNEIANCVYEFIKLNNLFNRVKIQAFDWRILVLLTKLDKRIKTAYLATCNYDVNYCYKLFANSPVTQALATTGKYYDHIIDMIKDLGGYSYEPEDNELSYDELLLAHSLGLKVIVWGWPEHSGFVFNTELIRQLIDWGVDGIITDNPAKLKNILGG